MKHQKGDNYGYPLDYRRDHRCDAAIHRAGRSVPVGCWLLVAGALFTGLPAHATLVQHKYTEVSGAGTGGTCANNTSTCSVTTAAIGAGNLVICYGGIGSVSVTINACSGDGDTWVHCPSCLSGASNKLDAWYVIAAAGGGTSVVCNYSSTINVGAKTCAVEEYSHSSFLTFDTSGNGSDDLSMCTSCPGVTLTVTGKDIVLQATYLPASSCTSSASAGFVGAAPWTNPADFFGATAAEGGALTQTNGSAPMWNCSGGLGLMLTSAIAFAEPIAGGTGKGNKLRKLTDDF